MTTAMQDTETVYVLTEHLVTQGGPPQTKAVSEHATLSTAIAAREAAYLAQPALRGALTIEPERRPVALVLPPEDPPSPVPPSPPPVPSPPPPVPPPPSPKPGRRAA